jgi:hypothetical protein
VSSVGSGRESGLLVLGLVPATVGRDGLVEGCRWWLDDRFELGT